MKKGLVLSAMLSALIAIGSPLGSAAIRGGEAETKQVKTTESTVEPTEKQEEGSKAEMESEVRSKREEIQQKISEKRAAITDKLADKKLRSCEKRQATINRILDTRIGAAQKHFDRFQAIQNKLVDFVSKRQLQVNNAAALALIMNDKQAAAQAAIEAAAQTDFTCNQADANAPGKIVTDQVSAQKQALKEYRAAIKDYAAAVKLSVQATHESETAQ